MSSLLKDFGRRVQQLAEERKFSRADLGRLIRLGVSQLGYIERGESGTRIDVMERMARVLLVDPADLLVHPWREKQLKQRARELIRYASEAEMPGLVEAMERYLHQNREQAAPSKRQAK